MSGAYELARGAPEMNKVRNMLASPSPSTDHANTFIERLALQSLSTGAVRCLSSLVTEWNFFLSILCLLASAAYALILLTYTKHFFWDVDFYAAVVRAMNLGHSPYDNAWLMSDPSSAYSNGFVYPPAIALLFDHIQWIFISHSGRALLICFLFLSWLAIPYFLAGRPKRPISKDYLWIWSLYLALFGFAGVRLLAVGNIAALLFAALTITIGIAIERRDYRPFWIVLLICSFIKPYFLGFLIFPAALDRQYWQSALLVASLASLYATNYFLEPQLFTEYLAQLSAQQSHLSNIGISFFTLASSITRLLIKAPSLSTAISIVIHLWFVAVIFLISIAVTGRTNRSRRFDSLCCWLFLSGFLISPRLFDYDLALIAVPFALLVRDLVVRRQSGAGVAIAMASVSLFFTRIPAGIPLQLSDWSPTFLIAGIWLGTAVDFLASDSNAEQCPQCGLVPLDCSPTAPQVSAR